MRPMWQLCLGPVLAHGGEGFVRFSYANSAENIERAIERIRKVL